MTIFRTQESASNDNDIKSVEVRAEMEPFTVEDQQQDGNGNIVVSPTWKHWFRRLVQWRHRDPSTSQFIRQLIGHAQLGGFTIFKFSQLAASTNNFSYQNKIGEGSFGPVYKGVLANGVHVAIKKRRVFPESIQSDVQFENELQIIPKLQHANVIKLLGCCTEGNERILVYEYMPKRLKAGVFLSWPLRCRIIEGIAQGAAYLHHHSRLGSLVHGDLKPGNILLDCDMNPRISDFGLVEVLESEEDEKEIDAISGTPGYIDPLLVEIQRISTKSDVYGFGATSLVIMTAHDPLMEFDTGRSLVGHSNGADRRRAMELIDASLRNDPQINEILRCMHIALLCVQPDWADRPTMSEMPEYHLA
ncbi:hypothetical protein PVAP13_8KG341802 [Panicum virgatum]|uniref:non-specific serine/threonine protein kinase n=1 Tax=Panicum virgatum TaxID=38727 RepID=A0A8T0PUH9_PANVG|nr:hypothetical protein PVAP13_8KG341802 [Panicum virgatum]